MLTARPMESALPAGQQTSRAKLKGVLYMSAYGAMFPIVEALGSVLLADYSAYQVVWGRYLVHLVLTFGVMLVLDRSIRIRSACPGTQLTRSAMMLVMPVAFVLAAGEAPVDFVWTLLWLAPLVAMAWERWFRGVSVTALDWTIAVACVAGTVLVFRPEPGTHLAGTAFALLSAASLGVYISLTGELRRDAIRTSLFYTATVPFVAMSLLMPWIWRPVSPKAGLLLIAVGALGWLALLALDKGVRLLGAGQAAVFAFLAIIVGALIARETGHAATIAGAGIIGIALIGAAIRAVRRRNLRDIALQVMDSKNER
jgi:drug/metabolite transporter (DMT)-like permease